MRPPSQARPAARQRVLVLFAHPALQKSRANTRLLAAARGLDRVTVHDLYETYPDLYIDTVREQKLLLEHEIVVFQFPFYWYSTPSILKQWQDVVLEYGWAYGKGGSALRGKTAVCALTTGGPEEAYAPGGANRFRVPELLRPLEQTAVLCGMEWLPPFVVYAANRIPAHDLDAVHAPAYRGLLVALRDGTLDRDAARRLERLGGARASTPTPFAPVPLDADPVPTASLGDPPDAR